jgi:bis(5'-nucleosidyl)-tetraphosphatase
MPKENSVGIVLYSGNEFLLLKYIPGHWSFVKGKTEGKETREETARRELEEETGMDAVHLAKDFEGKESYFFRSKGKTIYKEVHYFLGESQVKDVKLSDEHLDYKWLKYEEAMSLVTFKETKNILKDAHDYLKRHGVF